MTSTTVLKICFGVRKRTNNISLFLIQINFAMVLTQNACAHEQIVETKFVKFYSGSTVVVIKYSLTIASVRHGCSL